MRRGCFVHVEVECVAEVLEFIVGELTLRIHGAGDAECADIIFRHDAFFGEHAEVEFCIVCHNDSIFIFKQFFDLVPLGRVFERGFVHHHFV